MGYVAVRFDLVELNAQRMIGITQFRQQMAGAMEQVREGKTLHIVQHGELLAHVVPANALIVDGGRIEEMLLRPAIVEGATRYAREVMDSGYLGHVGDDIGLIFAWLWDRDPTTAVRWIAVYAYEFDAVLRQHRYSRPEFRQLWYALACGLGAGLRKPDIQEFEQFTREHLPLWSSPELFTRVELGGGERPRDNDDPWPDTAAYGGRGYAKRRWCHLEAGQMIPNPDAGHALPSTNQWCRIDTIDGPTATLVQSTGSKIEVTIADVATWIPTINKTPYRWAEDPVLSM